MGSQPYQLLDHTADIRVRVVGKDLQQLFRNAAMAMFAISAHKKNGLRLARREIAVRLTADNLEALLIDWLNELLSLSATERLIFDAVRFARLNETSLAAYVTGEPIQGYTVSAEIKAATYHQLTITKARGGWKTEVIFDV